MIPHTPNGTRIPHAWSFPRLVSRGFAQQIDPEILTYFTVSVDWDNDGDLDLLGGYQIGLRLMRNIGTTARSGFRTACCGSGRRQTDRDAELP